MPLAIRSLRLAAFRSYPRAAIEPGPGLIALAGPNGAGKTNVLEAISLLSPGRGLRRARPQEIARRQAGIGWSVAARLDTSGDPVEFWTGVDAEGRRIVKRDDKPATVLSLGRIARILWLTPALDRVFSEGPGERRRFLDRMTLSLVPEHAEAASRYDKAMRERNRLLRDGVADARWLGALEAQMAEHGVAMARARADALEAVRAAQGAEKGAFPRAEVWIEGFGVGEDAACERFARALAEGRSRDAQAGRTLDGPHRSDLIVRYAAKDAPASDCSTGEQKALLVSLMLANARALAARTGAPPILLLDEIAAHFDADRRAALFGEIAALGAQAWLTGTEWHLFEALGPDALRLEVRDGGEGSTLARLA